MVRNMPQLRLFTEPVHPTPGYDLGTRPGIEDLLKSESAKGGFSMSATPVDMGGVAVLLGLAGNGEVTLVAQGQGRTLLWAENGGHAKCAGTRDPARGRIDLPKSSGASAKKRNAAAAGFWSHNATNLVTTPTAVGKKLRTGALPAPLASDKKSFVRTDERVSERPLPHHSPHPPTVGEECRRTHTCWTSGQAHP